MYKSRNCYLPTPFLSYITDDHCFLIKVVTPTGRVGGGGSQVKVREITFRLSPQCEGSEGVLTFPQGDFLLRRE